MTRAFLRARKRRRTTFNIQEAPHKPSVPKGKQGSKLKRYLWKSILKGYVPKTPMTQWAVSTYSGLCRARNRRSAVLSPWTHP